MTPKEKANELVESFLNNVEDRTQTFILSQYSAKTCALISVGEILNDSLNPLVYDSESEFYIFWDNVINEINLL